MHILVLGATGDCGLRFVHAALAHDHTLTLFVRNASKLPASASTHSSVRIAEGSIHDEASFSKAFEPFGDKKVDAVVSLLGPINGQPDDTPITRGHEVLYKLCHTHDVKRLVLLGTTAISDPEDSFSFIALLIVTLIRLVLRSGYNDIVALGKTIDKQRKDGLDITLARIPILAGESPEMRAGYIGSGNVGWTLSRDNVAKWFLTEVETGAWIGKSPMISN